MTTKYLWRPFFDYESKEVSSKPTATSVPNSPVVGFKLGPLVKGSCHDPRGFWVAASPTTTSLRGISVRNGEICDAMVYVENDYGGIELSRVCDTTPAAKFVPVKSLVRGQRVFIAGKKHAVTYMGIYLASINNIDFSHRFVFKHDDGTIQTSIKHIVVKITGKKDQSDLKVFITKKIKCKEVKSLLYRPSITWEKGNVGDRYRSCQHTGKNAAGYDTFVIQGSSFVLKEGVLKPLTRNKMMIGLISLNKSFNSFASLRISATAGKHTVTVKA